MSHRTRTDDMTDQLNAYAAKVWVMKTPTITLEIATYNLGQNTAADNAAYCAAIESRLEAMFPAAAVYVSLTRNGDRDVVNLDGFYEDDDTKELIMDAALETAQTVWNEADYGN